LHRPTRSEDSSSAVFFFSFLLFGDAATALALALALGALALGALALVGRGAVRWWWTTKMYPAMVILSPSTRGSWRPSCSVASRN
jgi:hypothetical protein